MLILKLFFLASALFAQEKVAVLVSTGDLGNLEDSMKTAEKKAIDTYKALGFRVIVIGGVNAKASDISSDKLRQTLTQLKDVKDLRLDFIGHGALLEVPADKFKGEGLSMSKSRIKNGYAVETFESKDPKKLAWFAASVSTDSQIAGYTAKILGEKINEQQHISHVSIKTSLEEFQKQNPQANTTMNFLNCFSGAVAQYFRDFPKTIVFANSPSNSPALGISEYAFSGSYKEGEKFNMESIGFIRPKDALNSYYENLMAIGDKKIDFFQLRSSANDRYSSNLKLDPVASYFVGRTPLAESVLGWCEKGMPNKASQKIKLKKDELNHTIIYEIESEFDNQKRQFEFAKNIPDYYNPKKKSLDAVKAQYNACIKPTKQQKAARDSEYQNNLKENKEWKRLRALYASNPNKPIQLYFDRYEKEFSDPKNHKQVVKNVIENIQFRMKHLEERKIDESRWGAFKSIADKVKSNSFKQEDIINRLLAYVRKAKSDCSTGNSYEPPCIDHYGSNESLLTWLPPSGSKSADCKGRSDYFECIMSGPIGVPGFTSEISMYWARSERVLNPKPFDSKSCDSGPYSEFLKVEANIKADQACWNNFKSYATESEWANLKRIWELGKRNVRNGDEIVTEKLIADPITETGKK